MKLQTEIELYLGGIGISGSSYAIDYANENNGQSVMDSGLSKGYKP
jgi:hypothetical protein